MTSYGAMPARRSALEFCELVDARQRGLDGVLPVPLSDQEQTDLKELLREYEQYGTSSVLEHRARRFLLVYFEREQYTPVLTDVERKQLAVIISPQLNQSDDYSRRHPAWSASSWSRVGWPRIFIAAGFVALLALGSVGIAHYIEASQQGSPPPGAAQQHPPALQVVPGTTDLQNLKQDYGTWEQKTPSDQRPQTGQPALLLLESGGYFASTKWTVAPTAAGWQQDIGGNVSNVDVKGSYADITNADGVPYLVGINQPFIFSSNPGKVLLIDPTGNVLSMSLAQATAVRQAIEK